MPEIEVSFDLECALCGGDLAVDLGHYRTTFKVTPCPACFATERDEGYNAGYEEAERA